MDILEVAEEFVFNVKAVHADVTNESILFFFKVAFLVSGQIRQFFNRSIRMKNCGVFIQQAIVCKL